MTRWVRLALILVAAAASIVVLILERPILGLDLRGGVMLLMEADFAADPAAAGNASTREQYLNQIIQTIRFRINESGLAETNVTGAGDNRVWVEIPCPAPPIPCNQPGEVRDLIERRGFLEFRKVIRNATSSETPGTLEEILAGKDGSAYVVTREPLLTGADIQGATPQPSGQLSGGFVVALTFTQEGAQKFATMLTSSPPVLEAGTRLAIVLDDIVQTAPTIAESLVTSTRTGGWRSLQTGSQIDGIGGAEEATSLSIILRSGNLPVPVDVIFEEAIGPTLGQDSINKGLFAFALAVALVFLFMVLYYKLAGIIADLTMILNLLILVAIMILLDATWTLPGIAGLILTIGMGLDSNVLIFERMREELRSGKSVRAAIDFGYERALLTVIDSHVTTLITALILFTFGTGAIKGFATTLSIGIFINLFAALVGTRFSFDLIKEREPRRLSI